MEILCVAIVALSLQAEEPREGTPLEEAPITDRDREHWAFRPLVRPAPPPVKDLSWVRNPIDRFILARLEEAGLEPWPPAGRLTLVRRVTFDLTGLPPTPEEVDAFLNDVSESAYDKLLDRLLASPAHGERWAQHWLDLARYAETDGFEHDKLRPQAWRYRDWVIEALNRDLPYDRFVRQQIAGDELHPGDTDSLIATGFSLCGPDMPDINSQDERRHMVLNDITSTVGSVFLGLQVGCAQCHDHKNDPISQADFYRLRAFFDNADLFAKAPPGRVLTEKGLPVNASFLMVRGEFDRPGPEVSPRVVRIADLWDEPVPVPGESGASSGRRSHLARWLTRPDHPLTTRVLVNRVWQHHFARGLVGTPSDFGTLSVPPTHPKLLDWLATELPRLGWSLKRLHRLILTSATYRQASYPRRNRGSDPENHLLAGQNQKRLEGEMIRDALLLVSDRLSSRRGGPGLMVPLPQEVLKTIRKGQWTVAPDREDHCRRSIYLFVRRNLRYPFFEVFDRPDTQTSCARRNRSTTAPQALTLFNSELVLELAGHFADRILQQAGPDRDAQIELCFRLALGRSPTPEERNSSGEFLREQKSLLQLCLAVFNLNEFIYID